METFKVRLQKLIEQTVPSGRTGRDRHTVFAKKIGISAATMDRFYNKGQYPKVEHLLLIAEKTGVSLDWLLTGKEKEESRTVESHFPYNAYSADTAKYVSMLLDILKSRDRDTVKAIKQNLKAFKKAVDQDAILRKSRKREDPPGDAREM